MNQSKATLLFGGIILVVLLVVFYLFIAPAQKADAFKCVGVSAHACLVVPSPIPTSKHHRKDLLHPVGGVK
jgi:hypothetical protein